MGLDFIHNLVLIYKIKLKLFYLYFNHNILKLLRRNLEKENLSHAIRKLKLLKIYMGEFLKLLMRTWKPIFDGSLSPSLFMSSASFAANITIVTTAIVITVNLLLLLLLSLTSIVSIIYVFNFNWYCAMVHFCCVMLVCMYMILNAFG